MTIVGQGMLEDDGVLDRFESRLEKDAGEQSCWDWIGAYLNPDYFQRCPMLRVKRANLPATAFAWALEHGTGRGGRVPELVARCRNPCCVRPDHLVRGTWTEIVSKPALQRLYVSWTRDGIPLTLLGPEHGIDQDYLEMLFAQVAYGDRCMARVESVRSLEKMRTRRPLFTG